jgi:hypothetical protein
MGPLSDAYGLRPLEFETQSVHQQPLEGPQMLWSLVQCILPREGMRRSLAKGWISLLYSPRISTIPHRTAIYLTLDGIGKTLSLKTFIGSILN